MFRPIAFLCLRMFGWDTKARFDRRIKKCVIIVGPHTSGWDIVVGVLYRSVAQIGGARFLGKKELFDGPFGYLFKWLGGTPVDRFSKQGLVEQVVEVFNKNEQFILALSPEGTRQRVEKLRTGFYHIAIGAKVPIIMAGLDFGNKKLILSNPFYPGNDEKEDFQKIISFFAAIKGKVAENGMQDLLKTE